MKSRFGKSGVAAVLMMASTGLAHAGVVSDPASSLLIAYGAWAPQDVANKSLYHDSNTSTIITYLRYGMGMGVGYDFGGIATVDSFFIGQDSSQTWIDTARVYYTGGYSDVTLNPTGTQTLMLPQSVKTGFIFVRPLNAGGGNAAITEFYVNGTSPSAPRANVLSGLISGTALEWHAGWDGTGDPYFSWLTDGAMASNNAGQPVWLDPAVTVSASNNYLQFDMGIAKTVTTLGLCQLTGGEGGPSEKLTSVRLELSNDPSFTSGVTGFNFASLELAGYMQLDFASTTARYARLIATGRETSGKTLWYSGLWELQLFEPIPEPATLALLALGGLALISRRRR